MIDTVVTIAVVASASCFIYTLVTQSVANKGLGKIFEVVKDIQYMTHVALVQVPMVAHAEVFTHALFSILTFDVVDLADHIKELLSLPEFESFSIHLESCGYDSSYFLQNIGMFIINVLIVTPSLAILSIVMVCVFRCRPCNKL